MYAVVTSACAFFATPSAACCVPFTVAEEKPVIELAPFGQMPRSPLRILAPVLLTAEAPKTAKLFAVPRSCALASSGRADAWNDSTANDSDITRMIEIARYFSLCISGSPLKNIQPGITELADIAADHAN
jgi:hypothetical protein